MEQGCFLTNQNLVQNWAEPKLILIFCIIIFGNHRFLTIPDPWISCFQGRRGDSEGFLEALPKLKVQEIGASTVWNIFFEMWGFGLLLNR